MHARALKLAITEQLEESMKAEKLTKLEMARMMATSRSQLDRVLDPGIVSVQLDTLIKAARAVGHANSLNPIGIIVPCHRVIGSNGKLTGYAGGLQRKEWLLRHEQQHHGQCIMPLSETTSM